MERREMERRERRVARVRRTLVVGALIQAVGFVILFGGWGLIDLHPVSPTLHWVSFTTALVANLAVLGLNMVRAWIEAPAAAHVPPGPLILDRLADAV